MLRRGKGRMMFEPLDSVSFRTALLCSLLAGLRANGEVPEPVLDVIYPAGAAAGSSVTVEITGKSLTGLRTLRTSIAGLQCEVQDGTHCRLTIPAGTLPGSYDVWAEGGHGISSPRTFVVSHRNELVESAANDSAETAWQVPLNSMLNGRSESPGDVDFIRFEARQGQRVILECQAERIDSRLRAVLEVFDVRSRRLAVNRGYFGVDPLIDFAVPADGAYIVKLHDLVYSGGAEHVYRLEIDAGPRVAFTVPNVVPRGQGGRVTLFGWNLNPNSAAASQSTSALDQLDVEIPSALAEESWPLPVRLGSHQATLRGFSYHPPGSHASTFIGVTDIPVQLEQDENHSRETAQPLSVPGEISGRLVAGEERDWYAFDAVRGEVFEFDLLSHRFGAPTDLQLSLWNAGASELLAEWNDEIKNVGGSSLPTHHLDPSGRWTTPANGRYLLMIRNLSGGLEADPRRNYRLSVRREEPDFELVAVPRSKAPSGFNLRKGGRFAFDVLALRQRGLRDAIRVSAKDLPIGVECPEIVLGPDVDRGIMVISAEASAADQVIALHLTGHADSVGQRPVRGGTVVRAGQPSGWSRLISEIPLAVSGEAPLRITAAIQDQLEHHLYGKLRLQFSPGSVLDVAVTREPRDAGQTAAIKLTGVGVPPGIPNQTAVIPAGERTAMISFHLPPTLAEGNYSFAISGETTADAAEGKSEAVTAISNPVTVTVTPAAFQVELDPFAPRRVKRGETFQVKYSTPRTNGFIGKIHTEIACPGIVTNVPGLRGRGVTFVGQAEEGSIQIVVNEDARKGPVPFLRLFGVGVLEDQPTYYGSALFPLEIVE